MEGWENFFLGHVGASAALGGLLFVAISLNLSQISSAASLADRALLALSLILAILVVSSFMLMPRQPPFAVGVEVLVVGLGVAALAAFKRNALMGRPRADAKQSINAILLVVALLPYFVGGLLIVAGQMTAGLYFVGVAIILSFLKAVLDAWVLLIEINR
jgi:hypothetical protein